MPAIVCRDRALSAVTGALERPPALVLVEGEAGIGKTRLVQECLWSGRWPQRTVLMVECHPVAEPMPLEPVVNALRRLREEVGSVRLSPLGGALRPLFPEWVNDLPPPPEPLAEPGARRHLVYLSLAELVDRLGVDLLVVEDAHWADPASLEWLLLACEGWGDRRSVVVTFRSRTVPSLSPQLRRLGSRMPAGMGKVRVVLQPLDVAGIQQLTAAMFRTRVSREFAEFLHERTGGLPLAVEECLKLLRERGDIVRQDGEWGRKELTQMQEVPPNLRDSVLERVERLDPRTRRVLEAAAVLGESADDRLLAKVAGLDVPAARSGVAAGFRAGLLRGAGVGRVAFRHQLAAEAVAAEIPAFERPLLHKRAGDALEKAGEPSVARLSHHFKEAGDVDAWARYAEAVADLALQSGDDRVAVAVLHELLTAVNHPGERRTRLARKLGEAAASGTRVLGDWPARLAATLRAVLAESDALPGERGEIRLLLGRLLSWSGHMRDAYREIEAAVPDLDHRPELACRAMLMLGMPLIPDRPAGWHLQWVKRATARLSDIESTTDRLSMMVNRVTGLLLLGEEDGWHAAAELPQSASTMSDRRAIAVSMLNIGQLAVVWGRDDDARWRLAEAIELLEATGYRRALNAARVASAYLAWCTGAWAGLRETAAGLAKAEETEPDTSRLDAQQIQGLLDLAGGAHEEAQQCLREVADELSRRRRTEPEAALPAAALGRIHLADGEPLETLRATEPAMSMIVRKQVWLWAADLAPVHLDALVATGELNRAKELAEQFASWLTGRKAPAPAAASLLCQGIVAEARDDLDKAGEWYAQASRAWAALPRPYSELLARERHGRCLLAATESDHGLAILSDARLRLQDLGARWDADRIARLLQQRQAEVPRDVRRGPGGGGERLSPRELEVVALVAQGMTNREVGRVLFLSPRTVGHHLSRAMRKLRASTRTSAAMAAVDAGLIPSTPEDPVADTPARG